MKKYFQITIVLGVFFLFVLIRHEKSGQEDNPVMIGIPSPTPKLGPDQNSSITPTSVTSIPTPTQNPTGQYKDGSYTGDSADAYYGNIQVQVSISNGQIADVIFLQYPNDNNTSVSINQQAMPLLKSEALQAQNENVDGVSGASDSSNAFKQSLASALQQAKIK